MGKVKTNLFAFVICTILCSCFVQRKHNLRQDLFPCDFSCPLESGTWKLIYLTDFLSVKHYFPDTPFYACSFNRQGCMKRNDTVFIQGNININTPEPNFRHKYYCKIKTAEYTIDTIKKNISLAWFYNYKNVEDNIGYYDLNLSFLLHSFLNGTGSYEMQSDTLKVSIIDAYYNKEVPIKAAFIKIE